MAKCALVAGCALLLGSCGGGDGDASVADAGTQGAVARFAPGDGAALAWADVPFPSDLYLDAAGHPRLGALPTRQSEGPRFQAMRELLSLRSGFCTTCNAYFAVDGSLDPASVPASASPGEEARSTDAVLVADVDPASPERGRLFPLRVEYDARGAILAVRPVRGLTLHRDRRYAVALTSSLRAADGSPLAPSEAFAAVRDGRVPSDASPGLLRAAEIVTPALDELVRAGVERERIVSVAAFTTGDPTRELVEARAAVHDAPTPVAVLERVWSSPEELDDLLGVPAEDRPGIDVPPAAGSAGTRAIRHATVAAVVTGRFTAPRMVTGAGDELGVPRRDDAGRLVAGPLEEVPFVLIVPAGAELSRLPVVVHHHGFNASRVTGFVLADTAGAAGAAVLSIDGFQHGERASSAEDRVHAMRGGIPGPDGFAETDLIEVSARVFGLEGTPPGMELVPDYPLGAFLQLISDAMAAVRFVREGDLTAVREAAPELATLTFDPARVFYAGNSMGAVVGAGVLLAESDVAGYVLNVQPGSVIESLAEAVEFRGLTTSVFLPLLGVTGTFDERERSLVFDPILDLFRWAVEPIDPLALARHLLREPVAPGPRPDVLVQLASLDQLAAPPAAQSMLAAAGVPGIGAFELAQVPSTSSPAVANLATPSGEVTAAAVRFDPAAHGMLEIASQPSTHELPLVPPLVPRAEPVEVLNPIAAVHAQITTFLRSRIEGGRAEIR